MNRFFLILLSALCLSCVKKPVKAVDQAVESTSTRGYGASTSAKTAGEGKSPAETIDEIYGKSVAVVIGIDRYEKLNKLSGAVRDAKAVSVMLEARGFEVIEILDKKATRDRLYRLVPDLMRRLKPDDRLFFYFAGHGVDANDEGYLMPIEGETWEDGINMSFLQKGLETTQVKQIFYASDACYSGLGLPSTTRAGEEQSLPKHWRDAAAGKRYVSLSAGGAGETAYDAYSGPDGKGPHGLFTYFLLNGLAGAADSDADGWITDVELYAHVSNRVPTEATDLKNHKQNPQVGFSGEGRILFANPQIAEIRASKDRQDQIEELKLDLSVKERELTMRTLLAESRLKAVQGQMNASLALARLGLTMRLNQNALNDDTYQKDVFQHAIQRKMHHRLGAGSEWVPINRSMAYSPSGKIITAIVAPTETLDTSKTLKLQPQTSAIASWDTETGDLKQVFHQEDEPQFFVYSPNGKKMAVATSEQVSIWRHDGKLLHTLVGSASNRIGLASPKFSTDGSKLATLSQEAGKLIVWDVETGQAIRTLVHPKEDLDHRGEKIRASIFDFVYSPIGETMASSTPIVNRRIGKSSVFIWDVATGKPLHHLHINGISTFLAYSPDGKQLAVGSVDSKVRIFDVDTAQLLHTITVSDKQVESLVYGPKGLYLAIGVNTTIQVWDIAEEKLFNDFGGFPDGVKRVVFSADGLQLAAHTNYEVMVLNTRTGEKKVLVGGEQQGQLDSLVTSIDFSPGTLSLAVAKIGKPIELHKLTSALSTIPIGDKQSYVRVDDFSIDFSRHGEELAVLNKKSGKVKVWDAKRGRLKWDLTAYDVLKDTYVNSFLVSYSPTSDTLLTHGAMQEGAGKSPKSITKIWKLGKMREESENSTLEWMPNHLSNVVAKAVSKKLTPLELGEIDKAYANFSAVQSLDGTKVYTAGFDKTIRTWDAVTGEMLDSQSTAPEIPMFLSMAGDLVLTFNDSQEFKVWGKQGQAMKIESGFQDVVTSEDGSVAAVLLKEKGIQLWDLETGTLLHHIKMFGSAGKQEIKMSFSKDASLLLVGFSKSASHIWDVKTGKKVDMSNRTTLLEGGSVIAPHGQFYASLSLQRGCTKFCALSISSTRNGKSLHTFNQTSEQSLASIVFSDNGERIAALSKEKIQIWRLPPYKADELLLETGESTNARVCKDSLKVVYVVPFPEANTVLAPDKYCQ